MNGKQLKNSILQWAIQGKLVPQDPNDEPASVLLEKIRAEKARLIKEGKIKKDKKESIIYRGEDNSYYEKFADGQIVCIDEEVPFEIPKGWEWCRLGFICSKFSTGPFGTMVHKSDYTDDGIPLVNPTNIKGQQIVGENICKVAQTKYEELRAYVLSENDIVLARRGDLSKCAIVNKEHRGWLAGTGSFFLHILGISLDFFIMLYTSPYAQEYLIGDSVGTTMNNLNQGLLSRMLIPIPPFFEQSRILEHYRFIMPIIERYTVAYSERKALDNVLPLQIKKSVLQEAIQGKLVPQNPKDESASLLLEEKLRLVKEGKLKKKDVDDSVIFKGDDNKYYEQVGNNLIDITDDIPFDIPSNWIWTRIGYLFAHNNGKQLNKGNSAGTLMEYITTSNLYWDGFRLDNLKMMPFEESEIERCQAIKGDLLVCEGGDVGRSCIWTYDYPIMLQNHIHKLRAYLPLCTKYFFYIFYLYNLIGLIGGKGIGIQGFSAKALHNTIIPLPPLKEQERIVKKIEIVFDRIKAY